MPEYPPTNIRQLRPSRSGLAPGDIFTMGIPDDRYLFGRVVRTDAHCFAPGCILIYVFRYLSREPEPPPRLLVGDLLIPPATVNRLGWSRGYFKTVARRPFEDGERLPLHYFRSVRRGPAGETLYVTEDGEPLGPPPAGTPVGVAGLGNYRTVDDDISRALGIPPAADESPARH